MMLHSDTMTLNAMLERLCGAHRRHAITSNGVKALNRLLYFIS